VNACGHRAATAQEVSFGAAEPRGCGARGTERTAPLKPARIVPEAASGPEFVDVQVPREQQAPLRFTFFWTDRGCWEGRDYEVGVEWAPGLAPVGRGLTIPAAERLALLEYGDAMVRILVASMIAPLVTVLSCASSLHAPARTPQRCAVAEARCSSDADCSSMWCVNGECEQRDP
jgi:hypothetical protein